jgi:uncharacterized membrane protein YjgN (DUF898 family)
MLAMNFDILTYRKGRIRRVAEKRFVLREARLDGRCGFRAIVATHSGMIVATDSGVIVATHSGGLLPPPLSQD